MDILTKEQRRERMQRIRSKGSRIEVLLGKALWTRGLRYRKNDPRVFGKPDFTFKRRKVAVFCDSEFWHGKNWRQAKRRIKGNQEYWLAKIERNIRRDREVNRNLRKEGWVVLRFWAKDLQKDPNMCAQKVEEAILKRGQKMFHA
ncbi:MAG: very short patch repair endonuclease [Blastocatellia bacterium]